MSVAFDSDITLTIEAGFGDDPLSTGRTWTDISKDVRRFRTRRGRTHYASNIRTGQAQVWLNNTSGAYDPSNVGGAYTPNVRPMVPIRISGAYTSTGALTLDSTDGLGSRLGVGTQPLFTGFAKGWKQNYKDGNDPTATLSAVDGLKILNLTESSGQFGATNTREVTSQMLRDVGWPAAWIDGYSGTYGVQTFRPRGSLLRSLHRVEDTEGGTFFIQPEGEAMFHNQGYRAGLSPVATFGDSSTELPYSLNFDLDYDEHQLWTTVSVTRQSGVTQTTGSTAGADAYVSRDLTITNTLHTSDADALDLAGTILARYKDPALRLEAITVNPQKQPADLWPAVLTFDIGANVTVNRRPPAGNVVTLDSFVEGIEHDVAVGRTWDTTFRLSQYS